MDISEVNLDRAKDLFFKSIQQQEEGNLFEAKILLEKAHEIYPNRDSVINNLLVIYFSLKDYDGLNSFLLKLKPETSYYIICDIYIDYFNKNFENCIKKATLNFNKFENIQPQLIDISAKCYFAIGDISKLFKSLRESLKNKNLYSQYLFNVGNFLLHLSKPRAGKYFIEKSLSLAPNLSYHSSLAHCYLQIKNFDKGLDLWESRWIFNHQFILFKNLPKLESLQSIANKKVVVWFEQGLGDTLNFARYVKLLKHYCSDISFVVQDKLLEIFAFFDEDIKILSYSNAEKINFDYQISIIGLMRLLKINYDQINYEKIYIKKNIQKNNFFLKNIGFANSGNAEYFSDNYRSINPDIFSTLFKNENINFFKLHSNIEQKFQAFSNVTDLGHFSITEVANKIFELDLIITTDTFLVHLCGFLNINCILILNYNSDWRWFDDRKYTKWYPSVKIIKQKKLLDWTSVIKIIDRFLKLKSKI